MSYKKQKTCTVDCVENILDFPTEILITIFTYLLPSDRRVASECCKRFLEIWLRDIFIDDRRLVFEKCVLDPLRVPCSILLKSQRNYRHLVFGDAVIRAESDLVAKFGETVTTIEFKHAFKWNSIITSSFLSRFSNLETVKVENIKKLSTFYNLRNLLYVSNTVKLLQISGGVLRFDDVSDKMKGNHRNNASDSFRVEINVPMSTKDILHVIASQRHEVQRLNLYVRNDDVSEFKQLRLINLKHLDLHLRCDCGTEDLLDTLEEQFPALENLSLTLQTRRLPHKNWTYLKKLVARDISKEAMMSRIGIFENLKELTLIFTASCFFVHDAFLNKNLKNLTIDLTPGPCFDPCFICFQQITKSFPELENFTCGGFKVTNNHLQELATNTSKLKCLKLLYPDPSLSLQRVPNLSELTVKWVEPETIETWPVMLHLRKLQIILRHLDFQKVKIFENLPTLEDLVIKCESIDDDHLSLFTAMTKSLKRLRRFKLCCATLKNFDPHIVDVMATNCRSLRHVNFCNQFKSYEDEVILRQSIVKHSSLWNINEVWL